jgi:hypothetical protein
MRGGLDLLGYEVTFVPSLVFSSVFSFLLSEPEDIDR